MSEEIRRYIDTILFRKPDRVPLAPGGPRQSTLRAWRQQGLPEGVSYIDAMIAELGLSDKALLRMHGIDACFRMMPEYEPVILEHRDGHYVIRDHMGAITEISDEFDESYLRMAKDFVTRKWHKFPVENRDDWAAMKQRFDPASEGRIGADAAARCVASMAGGAVPSLVFNGVFWQLREWCGFENLCMLMAEDPDFVYEMASYWTDFVLAMLDRVLPAARPVRVLINEDMAYKAHSMISPAMTRVFILPAYRQWVRRLRQAGCEVVEVDSDGFIEELVPLWVEVGINCCSPIEVAANCDILRMRRTHGTRMAYVGGIDKRLIAVGGKAMEDHVMSIVPKMFEQGGYISGCDHGVPPDISWQNYLAFSKLLAKLSGWL